MVRIEYNVDHTLCYGQMSGYVKLKEFCMGEYNSLTL